jgi:hypothetical protein
MLDAFTLPWTREGTEAHAARTAGFRARNGSWASVDMTTNADRRSKVDLFSEAFDTLNHIVTDGLTVDQQLKLAEVQALLSISQELSRIHHQGINPSFDGAGYD